jgi:hypothetical protein
LTEEEWRRDRLTPGRLALPPLLFERVASGLSMLEQLVVSHGHTLSSAGWCPGGWARSHGRATGELSSSCGNHEREIDAKAFQDLTRDALALLHEC